ncbi:hypothetical protein GGR51DRAFT_565175 [Nemania sp. FL0031]|nr:hypothetical protein GGR51DRAFT_565175 [Nemania sp. FL0031]
MTAINWDASANEALVASIIERGNVTKPTTTLPLGRVRQWDAITDSMRGRGYQATKNTLQAQWSKLARHTLNEVRQRLTLPQYMSPVEVLEAVAIAARLKAVQPPSYNHQTQPNGNSSPFLHSGSGNVMLGSLDCVDPRNLMEN